MRKTLTASLLAAAAVAAPVGLATSAQAATTAPAATTRAGCTVAPLKPIFAGFNKSGVKLVDYRISAACSQGRAVSIQQQRYEEDLGWWLDPDDFLGSSSFYRDYQFASGSTIIHNVRTLVNTESGDEEVYQNVRFRVTSNGVTSPWTAYEKSRVLSISN